MVGAGIFMRTLKPTIKLLPPSRKPIASERMTGRKLQSRRLRLWSGNTLTLDKTIPSGGSGTVMLRGPEGQMKTVSVVSDTGDVDAFTVTNDMAEFPLPGDEGYEDVPAVDWAWFFDPLATPGRRFKITQVEPTEDGVKFQAIDDDPGYYASENNPYTYVPPKDGALLGGVVFSIAFTESLVNVQADLSNVTIGWAISSSMPVDVVVSINGLARPVVRTSDRQLTVQAQTHDVITTTVTPISQTGRGTPATQQYVVQGLTAPLPSVTGLTNVFRDGLTVLTWDRVMDVRNPDYEVRIGATWENSRPVGITTNPELLAVGNGLYWVAAHFVARGYVVYGAPDSLQIAGATLVRNVLAVTDEDPAWTGTLENGAIINEDLLTLAGTGDFLVAPDVLTMDDVLWYGGVESGGIYHTNLDNIIDIGYVTPVRVDFAIDEYALNFGENFLSVPDVLAYPDVLNVSNRQHYRVRPQIRSAQDDGVFGEWRDYVPGLINARYFDVRLVLETDDSLLVPFVRSFSWTIDVPDLVQRGEQVAVPATGLTVTYPKDFHAVPNVQIATFDAVDGDRYVLTNSEKTGFDIRLYNGATAVEREINWISQGY
jgi:hypothetical protein